MSITKGKWKVGKYGSTVVSDTIPSNYIGCSGHDDTEYYGGFLIGESISKDDAIAIAKLPEIKLILERTFHITNNKTRAGLKLIGDIQEILKYL